MAVENMAFFIGVFMTVSVSERLSPLYEGNGTNTRFDFTFRVFDQEDANGVSVKHQVGADFENVDESLYSVTINPDNLGGYINFLTPPEVGFEFYIAGETPVDQQLDITNYDNFYPDAIERSLDKLTAILQEWAHSLGFEKLSREKALELLDLAIQEQIREQGLALDQIDSYAKDLANRLTNIVIERGWLAELIVDGDETQKEINDKTLAMCETVAQLRTLIPRKEGAVMFVKSHSNNGSGGVNYIWNTANNDADDDGYIIKSNNSENGRWVADYGTAPITPRHFGAKADGANDERLQCEKSIVVANKLKIKWLVQKEDTYLLNS
ncbi:TPA: phage tail protein, partial [Acinetobacter baumannii]|nr:phage tail protein [Acinetobacter baumannii]